METKKCYMCGKILPVSEFYKNHSAKDGLQTLCKECSKKSAKARQVRKQENAKNMALGSFSSRELMKELFKRKYYGILYMDMPRTKEVEINGIKGTFSYVETKEVDITKLDE